MVALNRLLKYARPYVLFFVLAILIVLASAIVDLLPPQLIRTIIDSYVNNETLPAAERLSGIYRLSLLVLAVFTVQFLLGYLSTFITSYLGNRIVHDVRTELFRKVLRLPMSFFDKNPSGRITTRIVNDTQNIQEFFTSVITAMVKDVFLLAGTIYFLIRLSPKLFATTSFVFPIIAAAMILFRYFDLKVYREVRTNLAKVNAYLAEHISGMGVIKLFLAEDYKRKEFDAVSSELYRSQIKQMYVFGIFRPFISFVRHLATSVIIYFGARMILQETIKFGELYAFIAYIDTFMRPLEDISEKYDIVQNTVASCEKIFSLMDEKPELAGKTNSQLIIEKGELRFEDVWFSYDSDRWVLKGINVVFKPGELTAIVGETGAGKTSLMNLINGLYVPQKGRILIDGKDMFEYDLMKIRKQIAAVPQDVILFTGTILDNVRLFDETYSEEQVIEALKKVHAYDIVSRLSDGIYTKIVERGYTLSAGERQLIALARAVLFDAKILILDEATSNIDVETETRIETAIRELAKEKTMIMIAHKLSTVKNADRILVVHNGRIVEEGKHAQLLAKQGVYYQLYQIQFAS
ncbi:ABC transporter ATP-binding protein [Thermotoga sp. Ku-13t]|uniref:ABC transporter ATP-binding protein n=1 Tax=Thermotoga sp. Ku-13t TaxID=1755813 RepID=UPI0013ED795E|nr:ABC transporter ATP-binding protein [Thermotoga sp. Ku-13t]KAF2958377.1 ABC transporter ATP-binding protein [Thermotoga sp. Ku-13t]